MTTIIGVAGKDPETKEDYAILASDSRGTFGSQIISDNQKKLFTSSNSNYAIGVAGKCLEKYFSKNEQRTFYNFLNEPKKESLDYVSEIVGYLDGELKKNGEESNQYLLSMTEMSPKIMYFSNGKFMNVGSYSAIGSGIEKLLMHNGFMSPLKRTLEPFRENGRIHLPKKDTLDTIYNALNEISALNYDTGGTMSAAIFTNSGIVHLNNFKKLSDSLPSCQQYSGQITSKTVDDILKSISDD